MDPFILNLGIRWLPAVDAFSASCVSQEWRHFLSADRDNGDLWKQICRNSGPSGIPNLESSVDYQRLAMGLRLRDSKEPPAPQEQTYTPATRPEDYFAIVDIYKRHEEENGKRRKEIIASHVCPIEDTQFIKRNEKMEPILQGENPFSANMKDSDEVRSWRQEVSSNNPYWRSTPLAYVAHAVSRDFQASPSYRVDVSLFRRDIAKSVCLLHGSPLVDFDVDDDHIITRNDFAGGLTFAGSDTGMIARGLIDEHSSISAECFMTFAPKVPPPGSDDQPQWLVNSRQACQDRRAYEPNANDMASLSKIDHFEFGLEQVGINFDRDSEWDSHPLDDQNELILALEGLCWE